MLSLGYFLSILPVPFNGLGTWKQWQGHDSVSKGVKDSVGGHGGPSMTMGMPLLHEQHGRMGSVRAQRFHDSGQVTLPTPPRFEPPVFLSAASREGAASRAGLPRTLERVERESEAARTCSGENQNTGARRV